MSTTIPTSGPATNLSLDALRKHKVTSVDEVYEINGVPNDSILDKHTTYLTPLLMEYIRMAPFFLIATSDAEGNCDVSPKGDPPGVVRILDAHTLIIPDRPGNRRIDGHRNLMANPHIGLIFIIPGIEETLRVNGRAWLTNEPTVLAETAIGGKQPKLATVVEVEQAYMHCARSFLRAGLWKPETWPDPDSVPTLAAIYCEQKELPAPDESSGKRQEEYRKFLW